MGTKARKARKRAGVKFKREPRVGTPLQDRAWFRLPVWGAPGTKHEGQMVPRSDKPHGRKARALAARGIEVSK